MTLAVEWGTGQVLYSLIWLTFFVIWVWLLITVLTNLFRSQDLSGLAKALWMLFLIVFPYIGVFSYVMVRGSKMGLEQIEHTEYHEDMAAITARF